MIFADLSLRVIHSTFRGDPMNDETVNEAKLRAQASAEHWERLADEAVAQAAWDRDHGIDLSHPGCSAGDYQAMCFRQTAKALRLEATTGIPHCSTCFGPHANHKHPHRG
jgi:hypothetical protein